jgi:hypothetical protein
MVVGSEVPNLLEDGAASTLVVSQDVDIGVPVAVHAEVKRALDRVAALVPAREEPSVWVPRNGRGDLIEVNFLGIDPARVDPTETYELPDERLPLMVFAPLSLLRPGRPIAVGALSIPVPRPAGLALEKLITDRTGEKGERDLLVVAGLLATMRPPDIEELVAEYRGLGSELRHAVRSSLSVLALIDPRPQMPDPRAVRGAIADLLRRLEAA